MMDSKTILTATAGALIGFGAAAFFNVSGAKPEKNPTAGATADKRRAPDRLERALALQDAGKDAEAALAYEEVLKKDPGNLDVRFNLAVACENLGRKERAFDEYRKILERDPERLDALAAAADLSLETGHPEAALRLHRRLAEIRERELREVHRKLGRIEANLQRGRDRPPPEETLPDDLLNELLDKE